MSTSQVMNQQLKVMRMAMTVSYWSSMVAGNTSRNAASILVIEDRLSVDTANKLGTRERIPLMIGAGAVFSNQLYQPIKYGVTSNLAIFDVFINGQHFPFSTSAFKDIILGPGHPTWEDPCYSIPTATKPIVGGCALAYKVVGNYTASLDWCDDVEDPPGTVKKPCGTINLPADDRFDLDIFERISDPVNNAATPTVDPAIRAQFSWQWFLVPALVTYGAAYVWQTLLPGRTIGALNAGDVADVDGDGKEEIIHDFDCVKAFCHPTPGVPCLAYEDGGIDYIRGVIECVRVTDSQEGDIDFTINDRDKAQGVPVPGLQDDVQMFSFTKGFSGGVPGNENGTYLRMEEGKLFTTDTGRFVRSTNRQDHIDIIQRIFRLSHDTNRFCDAYHQRVLMVSGEVNPVEACNDCFSATNGNVMKTCMTEGDAIHPPIIYIRSRIADVRGRRWVTKGQK